MAPQPPPDEPVQHPQQHHHRAMPTATNTKSTNASTSGAHKDSRNRNIYSKQDQEDLAAIDRSIERMRQLTPTDPYVLTIPQDEELRYRYTWQIQTRQWLDNTPFDPREDHDGIQYQTFILHDPSHEMYRQHSLRPKEKEEPNGAVAASGPGTPSTAPKKKITLGMYTKKQAGEVVTEDSQAGGEKNKDQQAMKKPAAKSPAERIKAEKESLTTVHRAEDARDRLPVVSPKKEQDGKRKRDGIDGEERAIKKTDREIAKSQEATKTDERPIKKQRMTPPPKPKEEVSSPRMRHESPAAGLNEKQSRRMVDYDDGGDEEKPVSNGQGMPPRLSPLHHSGMPSRLSPTLPDNIMATLKARAEYHLAPTGSDTQRLLPGKLTPLKHKSPAPRNGFRANSSSPAVRSDTEDRIRHVKHKLHDRTGTPENSQDEEIIVARRGKSKTPSDDERRSLVVKLKVGKAGKASSGKKPASNTSKPSDQHQRDRRDVNSKGVAKKVGPAPKMSAATTAAAPVKAPSLEKRSRVDDADDTEPLAKRKKAAVDHPEADRKMKEPTTPVHTDPRSPPVMSSAQKYTTPNMRKDAISASMRREPSNNTAQTPSTLLNSPTANGHSTATAITKGTAGKTSSSQPSNKTPLQQAWETEHRKLEALGRELKHASSAHLAKAENEDATNERRLAAITAIESHMAYIFAFTAHDEARRTADPPAVPQLRIWRSLQGYHTFVKDKCQPFPPLQGLACALGVVSNAKILEYATKAPPEAFSREHLVEVASHILKGSSEREARLGLDTLVDLFPRSWKGRAKGHSFTAVDKLSVGSWKGSYNLPINVSTPPLRAARAGYTILEEWITQERLKYEFKLKL